MCSVQRQVNRKVELRRLGNQLPVLGKATSLCKIVTFCVCCLFVNCDTRVVVVLAKSVWRIDDVGLLQYQLRPLAVKKY